MLLKTLKPLILMFVFAGLLCVLVAIDRYFSKIEPQKATIISIRDLKSHPVLFHAQLSFFRKVIVVKNDNGKEVEIIMEKVPCEKIGTQVVIDKYTSLLFGKITYGNIRDCK